MKTTSPRFRKGAPAQASLRGTPGVLYPLKFVRVEPYAVPKKSLTGDNTERVDTRVLEVIYSLDEKDQPIYVGQQMDVFIDVGGNSAGESAPAALTVPFLPEAASDAAVAVAAAGHENCPIANW